RFLMFTLPIALLLLVVYPVRPPATATAGAAFALRSIFALLIFALINFLVGTMALQIQSIMGVIRAKYCIVEFLCGLLLPVGFFPGKVRRVLLFLPFPRLSYTPLATYPGRLVALSTRILATVAGYGFVVVLFTRIPDLRGWSFHEVLFIYGFSLVPLGLFNIVSLNLYEFGDVYVVEGKFDRVLLRPVHSLFQVLFENFRLESLQEVVTG